METPAGLGLADDEARLLEAEAVRLFNERRYAEAVAVLERQISLQPGVAVAHSNLGIALCRAGRPAEAAAFYERAIALDPSHAIAYVNLIDLLPALGRPLDAVERARAARAALPTNRWVQCRVGRLFFAQGLREEARSAFAQALEIEPTNAEARSMQAFSVLPQAYGSGEDPAVFMAAFEEALDELDKWFDRVDDAGGKSAVVEGQPFYVAFHERSNKALLSRYGELCARRMAAFAPAVPTCAYVAPRGPVRLAIVSGHVYNQSVWTALVRGWCANLDRDLVELHIVHTGDTSDAETEVARASAVTFHMGQRDLAQWVKSIGSIEPSVILYPEIGMDGTSAKLASMRLARTQLVSWGHPETSGLPTLDAYLSGAAFEPPGAQANYRERLITLPNLGCYYDGLLPEFVGIDWEAFGLDPFVPRLLCAGTCYKYMPRDDDLLVEIARRLKQCYFLFFTDPAPYLSSQVHARIRNRFSTAGLDADKFVKLLPHQSRSAFFGMMRDCDVLLDTVGFSGFNTAMQAVECELPVVAWEGRFMRGRLASGIMRTMGMDELVATNREEYVEKAVRLCSDSTYRLKTAARIAQQSPVLFRDLVPVRALEKILQELAVGN